MLNFESWFCIILFYAINFWPLLFYKPKTNTKTNKQNNLSQYIEHEYIIYFTLLHVIHLFICHNNKDAPYSLLSLPYTHVLFKFDSNKFTPFVERKWSLFYWWMNFNLSHVCVPAILMITNHCYLNHKCPYWFVSNVFNWNHYPPCWFIQEHYIKFF